MLRRLAVEDAQGDHVQRDRDRDGDAVGKEQLKEGLEATAKKTNGQDWIAVFGTLAEGRSGDGS